MVGVGLTVRIWGVGPEGVLTKALNLQLRIWICRPAFKVSPEQRGMASGLSLGSSSGGAGEVKQVKRQVQASRSHRSELGCFFWSGGSLSPRVAPW